MSQKLHELYIGSTCELEDDFFRRQLHTVYIWLVKKSIMRPASLPNVAYPEETLRATSIDLVLHVFHAICHVLHISYHIFHCFCQRLKSVL